MNFVDFQMSHIKEITQDSNFLDNILVMFELHNYKKNIIYPTIKEFDFF